MHTTLEFLKSNDACQPGFGRMLRFFGTRFDRHTKIPLHVIALVGGKSDAEWALSSALIIDPIDYKKFRERTLVPMLRKAINGTNLEDSMHCIAFAESLPLAHVADRYKVNTTTLKGKIQHRLARDLWHVLGYDNEDYEPPDFSVVEAYIEFAMSVPDDLIPAALRRLLGKTPREYISQVFSDSRYPFITRHPTAEKPSRMLMCDEESGSDGYIIAKILQPHDTLSFMTTMNYQPRVSNAVQIEKLRDGRVRVVQEFDIESLDYLMLIRMQSDRSPSRYMDQDVHDNETNVDGNYPEYRAVALQLEGGETVWEYATPATPEATAHVENEDDEGDVQDSEEEPVDENWD